MLAPGVRQFCHCCSEILNGDNRPSLGEELGSLTSCFPYQLLLLGASRTEQPVLAQALLMVHSACSILGTGEL